MTLKCFHFSSIIRAINQTEICVSESRHLNAKLRNSIGHLIVDNTESLRSKGNELHFWTQIKEKPVPWGNSPNRRCHSEMEMWKSFMEMNK